MHFSTSRKLTTLCIDSLSCSYRTYVGLDDAGAVDFWWSHALISDTTSSGIKQHCNFSAIGPLGVGGGLDCDSLCNRCGDVCVCAVWVGCMGMGAN